MFFLEAGECFKEILIISQRQPTITHFMVTFMSFKEIIKGLRSPFFASSVLLPYICSSYPPNQVGSACFPPTRAPSSTQMNSIGLLLHHLPARLNFIFCCRGKAAASRGDAGEKHLSPCAMASLPKRTGEVARTFTAAVH